MQLLKFVATQTNISEHAVKNTIQLFNDDCTIAFIARYRKERTGNLDEVQIGLIEKAKMAFEAIEKRKTTILKALKEQAVLSDELNQKIAATNNLNANTIDTDEMYLMWGNDNGSLAAATPIDVDMSAGLGTGLESWVDFTSISRTWKVVETGGNMPTVKVSVPEISLSATITPPGSFLMFISSTPNFNPTSEYRIMTVNGDNLEASYDFTGTHFIRITK